MDSDIIGLVLTLLVCIGAIYTFVRNIKLERDLNERDKRDELSVEFETIRTMLSALMADNKNNLALRAYVIKEYGIQLSDNDILTLMIEWNKQLETSAEFTKFVKQFLEDKKWLYR